MEIHQILSEIMNQRNLSIADIARMSHLPDSTVRGIITRKQKKVALDVAFRLSDGLGVSLEYLNGLPENKKAPTKSVNALENELLDNFRCLDMRGQSLLCELSNAMVESGRYAAQTVDFAARGGQRATVNSVDDLESLLPPEDTSDI